MKHLLLLASASLSLPLLAMDLQVKSRIVTVEKPDPAKIALKRAEQLLSVSRYLKSSVTFSSFQRLHTNQHLLLLGETHTYNSTRAPGNQKNLQALNVLIETADRFEIDTPAFHIFVEHTMPVNDSNVVLGHKIPPSILCGLVVLDERKKANDEPFRRTTIENIEVRHAYCVTKIIMELEPHDGLYETYEEQTFTHNSLRRLHNHEFLKITWRDLIHDFNRLCSECEGYRDSWANPKIVGQFNRMLRNARQNFKPVQKRIEERDNKASEEQEKDPLLLVPDQSIFTFYKTYNGKDLPDKMAPFLHRLTESFSPFLDMQVFHRILLLRNKPVPIIIVYTGETHSREISAALGHAEITDEQLPAVLGDDFSI